MAEQARHEKVILPKRSSLTNAERATVLRRLHGARRVLFPLVIEAFDPRSNFEVLMRDVLRSAYEQDAGVDILPQLEGRIVDYMRRQDRDLLLRRFFKHSYGAVDGTGVRQFQATGEASNTDGEFSKMLGSICNYSMSQETIEALATSLETGETGPHWFRPSLHASMKREFDTIQRLIHGSARAKGVLEKCMKTRR